MYLSRAGGWLYPTEILHNHQHSPIGAHQIHLLPSSITFRMVSLAGVAALLFAAPPIAADAARSRSGGEQAACSKLRSKYPDRTFSPGTSGYVYETQERTITSWKIWPDLH